MTLRNSIFWQHRFETVSALGVLLWGAFLLNPKIDSFAIQKAYAEMAEYAPENAWGSVAFLIGLTGLFGLYLRNIRLRKAATLGAVFYRTFTLVFIGMQTRFTNAGTGDFALWATVAFFAFLNIGEE